MSDAHKQKDENLNRICSAFEIMQQRINWENTSKSCENKLSSKSRREHRKRFHKNQERTDNGKYLYFRSKYIQDICAEFGPGDDLQNMEKPEIA